MSTLAQPLTPQRSPAPTSRVDSAVARLAGWLASMRGTGGYSGPVVHWWRDSFLSCGAAIDWRYEGIIAGYVELAERTGDGGWLALARQAGDDVRAGQLDDGRFRRSSFELNPNFGGTPHESAVDLGLLILARALRGRGDDSWQTYRAAAERNLRGWYLGSLWNDDERRFRDSPSPVSTFVPNKSATAIEALCLLHELTGDDELLERYVRPTADAIVGERVAGSGSRLDGAISQNLLGAARVEKYLPYYQARCATGLLAAYERLGHDRYLETALDAMRFVGRYQDGDGAFPMIVYPDGRVNRFPRWVAPTGDILRAADRLREHGLDFPAAATLDWLLAGQLPSGAFLTGRDFAGQATQKQSDHLDFRDALPAIGWCDKAFRYLASQVSAAPLAAVPVPDSMVPVTFRGRSGMLHETERVVELVHRGRAVYRWRKGAPWAEVKAPWVVTA